MSIFRPPICLPLLPSCSRHHLQRELVNCCPLCAHHACAADGARLNSYSLRITAAQICQKQTRSCHCIFIPLCMLCLSLLPTVAMHLIRYSPVVGRIQLEGQLGLRHHMQSDIRLQGCPGCCQSRLHCSIQRQKGCNAPILLNSSEKLSSISRKGCHQPTRVLTVKVALICWGRHA